MQYFIVFIGFFKGENAIISVADTFWLPGDDPLEISWYKLLSTPLVPDFHVIIFDLLL